MAAGGVPGAAVEPAAGEGGEDDAAADDDDDPPEEFELHELAGEKMQQATTAIP